MPINPLKKESHQERRRSPRVAKNVAIKLKDKNVDFVTQTQNLSSIGAYCQIDTYLPVLTKLKVTLLMPRSQASKTAKPIVCEGTIVRIERSSDPLEHDKYNIALYFNQISKTDVKLIDGYVNTHLPLSQASSVL